MAARATALLPRRLPPSWTATLVLAACWLVAGPSTPDLAAQVHRAGMFAAHGFAVWDNSWYDGHHVPGYSLVFPAVAAALGVRLTGVVAAVGSAALFESLAGGRHARAACWWFAIGCVADLLVGRVTYALGVTAALAAVAALVRGRLAVAAALAVLCAATSPVAGLFLALAGVALVVAERRPRGAAMAATALVTALALSVTFPEGGTQPFSARAFGVTLAISLLAAVAMRGDRRLRLALALYVAAVAASFVVPSPMGANVMRLGTAFLAPLLLIARRPAAPVHRIALVVALVAAAAWQWVDPVQQGARGWGDPSAAAAYYRPLVAQLQRAGAMSGRVEVPFTAGHWESDYLARRFALARGWERQLDRRLNPLFYAPTLSAAAYERWLRRNAVRYVALPDAPMDPAGRAEAALVATAPTFLQPVWRGRHWRLFRVRGPLPLASGAATVVRLGPSDLRLSVGRPGPILLRVHWTPYWRLTAGSGCVARRGPWTALDARAPGTVVLTARFSVRRVLARAPSCFPPRPVTP